MRSPRESIKKLWLEPWWILRVKSCPGKRYRRKKEDWEEHLEGRAPTRREWYYMVWVIFQRAVVHKVQEILLPQDLFLPFVIMLFPRYTHGLTHLFRSSCKLLREAFSYHSIRNTTPTPLNSTPATHCFPCLFQNYYHFPHFIYVYIFHCYLCLSFYEDCDFYVFVHCWILVPSTILGICKH